MNKNELPKAYESSSIEEALYTRWEQSGLFNPENCMKLGVADASAAPFTVMMPPPNATGTLHLGHAVMLALQDIMTRFYRMHGRPTLWLPGTDHAAIATQSVVEKKLRAQGIENPRHELGREKLLEEIRAFVAQSKDTIRNQVRKMGSSCDWSREKYTLDDDLNHAVNEFFGKMYRDGLIYRGYRVVNWSVKGQSTCSDDELEHVEREANLYYFKYSADFPITIATTRPETKLGDTAVAVHPEDPRYKQYIGQTFTVDIGAEKPLEIKVIGRPEIDPEYGTGALGVTPAHSVVDYAMYEQEDIELIQVIGVDGRMMAAAGEAYVGLTAEEAREKFVAWLDTNGLLEKTETIAQNVSISDRYKDIIEPLPMTQWFIDVNKQVIEWKGKTASIKEVMQDVVRSGMISIVPERFEKTYFHWIDNLRDWCISRQIWWGHQIPIWYKVSADDKKRWLENPESSSYLLQVLGIEILDTQFSEAEPQDDGDWIRDPDTLDTWFSSALWTFSTLGWPEHTEDLMKYHPTSVLETGYDILPFWVARMILASTYCLRTDGVPEEKCIPFKDVYLHGLIKDRDGKKMSKSRPETSIDPLDMIEKYGTDAVRLSLVVGSTPGNDMRLYEEKIAGYRNFINKLWNISRFMIMNIEELNYFDGQPQASSLADTWILSELHTTIERVEKNIAAYQFSMAIEALRDFTWNKLADWYLEVAKVENVNGSKDEMLRYLLQSILKMWHPFAPYITEHIWGMIDGTPQEFLMVESWNAANASLQTDTANFAFLQEVISKLRNGRADKKIAPAQMIHVSVLAGNDKTELINQQAEIIKKLVRIETLDTVVERPAGSFAIIIDDMQFYIHLDSALDLDAERARLQKEIDNISSYITGLEKKLGNEQFTANAPATVVEQERDKLRTAQEKHDALTAELNDLG